ncbi:hypothetical protein HK096_002348, partial [Nowakowskiella sp. JEL0078]
MQDSSILPTVTTFSHVWGDTSSKATPCSFVEHANFPSEEWLNRCVQTVVDYNQPSWLDLTCINQSSEPDVQRSMPHMRLIYAESQRTIVLLDDRDYDTLRALTATVNKQQFQEQLEQSQLSELDFNLADVLSSPSAKKAASNILVFSSLVRMFSPGKWFERLWTLQEFILPKKLLFAKNGVISESDLIDRDDVLHQLNDWNSRLVSDIEDIKEPRDKEVLMSILIEGQMQHSWGLLNFNIDYPIDIQTSHNAEIGEDDLRLRAFQAVFHHDRHTRDEADLVYGIAGLIGFNDLTEVAKLSPTQKASKIIKLLGNWGLYQDTVTSVIGSAATFGAGHIEHTPQGWKYHYFPRIDENGPFGKLGTKDYCDVFVPTEYSKIVIKKFESSIHDEIVAWDLLKKSNHIAPSFKDKLPLMTKYFGTPNKRWRGISSNAMGYISAELHMHLMMQCTCPIVQYIIFGNKLVFAECIGDRLVILKINEDFSLGIRADSDMKNLSQSGVYYFENLIATQAVIDEMIENQLVEQHKVSLSTVILNWCAFDLAQDCKPAYTHQLSHISLKDRPARLAEDLEGLSTLKWEPLLLDSDEVQSKVRKLARKTTTSITLVDVDTMCCVKVQKAISYLCVSYVWKNPLIHTTEKYGALSWCSGAFSTAGLLQLTQTVKKLGFKWVWIDALCLKRKSGKLKCEDMYDVYANCSTCLVYPNGIDGTWNIGTDIPDMKWSTRIWTLQEQILPKQLLFYLKGEEANEHRICSYAWLIDYLSKENNRSLYDKIWFNNLMETSNKYWRADPYNILRQLQRRSCSIKADVLNGVKGLLHHIHEGEKLILSNGGGSGETLTYLVHTQLTAKTPLHQQSLEWQYHVPSGEYHLPDIQNFVKNEEYVPFVGNSVKTQFGKSQGSYFYATVKISECWTVENLKDAPHPDYWLRN